MKRIALILLAPCLLAAGDEQLKDRPATLPLSLKRAVEIATAPEGNARVQIAEELIRQAQSRALQARSALLPNFDSSVSYSSNTRNLTTFGLDFSSFPSLPGFRFPTLAGPFNVFDLRVSGNQTVFDFGSIRRFQAARTTVQVTKAEAQGTRDQVADQVTRAYVAALRADAALDTARANIQLSEALVKLANSQKAAGTGTGIEVTRAQVQLANDRQRFTVATNDRDRAHLQLQRLLGLKLEGQIALTDQLSFKPVDPVEPAEALKTALAERPDWLAQRDREASTRLNTSSVRWERLPSAAFFGDYGTTGAAIDHSLPTRTYGISVKLPLFDGGRRDARRLESESQLRAEQVRTRDLKDQVELDIRLALDSLKSSADQVTTAREGLGLAEKELEQARRRYEAGVASSIEITDAQARLQRARDNQIAALYAYNLARVDFHSAIGKIQDLVNSF